MVKADDLAPGLPQWPLGPIKQYINSHRTVDGELRTHQLRPTLEAIQFPRIMQQLLEAVAIDVVFEHRQEPAD